mmetsp:Transcript_1490/g.1783  ORF Transcript_1490/g.1783 Transcript_1490/m.1783 type:complete len:111 (+) Transcript_1490:176-508(+)
MEPKKVTLNSSRGERDRFSRAVTQRYDLTSLRKLQAVEDWLESSLETLYAGTEVSVPEFDLDKALKMSDTELHSYMETILSGSITSEQRQSFLTGFKQKANELASLKMKS